MFGIGVTELGIILVVALLVFGPKRLPELARMLGRGMGEFRRASNELRQSLALDDLQSDLRRGLDASGRIHKPVSPPDRPAQAGGDLAADGAPDAAAGATADTTADTTAGADEPEPASQRDTGSPSPSPARHPGELPLGNDDEHHDLPEAFDERADDDPALRESAPGESVPGESARDDGPGRMSPSGSKRG